MDWYLENDSNCIYRKFCYREVATVMGKVAFFTHFFMAVYINVTLALFFLLASPIDIMLGNCSNRSVFSSCYRYMESVA